MKNAPILASKWLGLGLGLLAGIVAIDVATPSEIAAQDTANSRRERRRDSLQDTFTGWDQLGSAAVSTSAADLTIQVASGAEPSDRIRLRVESAPLVVDHVVVTYANNERYEADATFTFSRSHRTYEIDLPGAARVIQRVDFHASELPNGQSAQVEVWSR